MIGQLEWFSIQHVLRGGNQGADRLANLAMDRGMGRNRNAVATTTGEDARRSTGGVSALSSQTPSRGQEFSGVVRDGVIVLDDAKLPEGTRVQIRIRE
jgi:probable phosphoglycerate mutase